MALIAWYKLDGNALDSSGSGHDGVVYGATPTDGKIGQALRFGGSEYVDTRTALIPPISNFSFSAWVNMDNVSKLSSDNDNSYVIASQGGDNFTLYACTTFGSADMQMRLLVNSPSLTEVLVGPDIRGDGWKHVALTRDGDKFNLYIDGNLYSHSVVTTTISPSNTWIARSSHSANRYLKGMVDDVRIYDHALSPKEVKELAKAKILHYKFDDFQEPTVNLLNASNFLNSLSYHTVENYNNIYPDKPVCRRLTRTSQTNAYYNYSTNFPIDGGSSYTFSFDVRLISSESGSDFIRVYLSDNLGDTYQSSQDVYLNHEWQRAELTINTNDGATHLQRIAFHTGTDNIKLNTVYEIANPQMEKKSHGTPFVDGEREGTVHDSSGYDNHAELALATTPRWVPDAKIGSGAYEFDGNGKSFIVNNDNLHIGDTGSISVWVYLRGLPSAPICQVGTDRAYLWFNASQAQIGLANSSNVNISWNPSSRLNTWHHFVLNWNKGVYKVYIDGTLHAEGGYSGSVSVQDGWYIGRSRYTDVRWFNGLIDDVRIYATTLSDEDILELYQTRGSLDNHGNLYASEVMDLDSKILSNGGHVWDFRYGLTSFSGLKPLGVE